MHFATHMFSKVGVYMFLRQSSRDLPKNMYTPTLLNIWVAKCILTMMVVVITKLPRIQRVVSLDMRLCYEQCVFGIPFSNHQKNVNTLLILRIQK